MSSSFPSFFTTNPLSRSPLPPPKKTPDGMHPLKLLWRDCKEFGAVFLKNTNFYLFWHSFFVAVGKVLFSVNGKLFNRQCLNFFRHTLFSLYPHDNTSYTRVWLAHFQVGKENCPPVYSRRGSPINFQFRFQVNFGAARACGRERGNDDETLDSRKKGGNQGKNFFFEIKKLC